MTGNISFLVVDLAHIRLSRLQKGEGRKIYHYIDAQAWIGYAGLGLGLMVDENRNKYSRFKCGAGLFGYLTYDYFKVFKHNYGLIGVRPRVNKFLN